MIYSSDSTAVSGAFRDILSSTSRIFDVKRPEIHQTAITIAAISNTSTTRNSVSVQSTIQAPTEEVSDQYRTSLSDGCSM